MAKILIAGLNPAWQQIFTLPALQKGEVNRAAAFTELASGKGLNVGKVLAAHGHDVSLLQVLAGDTGQRILVACRAFGIRSLHVNVAGETRVCATLLHAGETTEIIAPFSVQDPSLSARLLALVPEEQFDAILICGTMPSGLDDDVYEHLVEKVGAPLVVLDSVAGHPEVGLRQATWLKLNREEYRTLEPILATIPQNDRPSLLITDGSRPALLQVADGHDAHFVQGVLPALTEVVNPIGAGDTVTALLTDGLLAGLDARVAAGRALAAAAASCLNVLPATWNPEDAARLEQGIRWDVPVTA